ncbi:MAG: DUF2341 domain-containing protein [Thermofilum sp.]|uniref:DUF2341 domain-containing protein n=1 Tax=Thermofilum sp. TaxID=1961369 RepID=UPI00258DBF1F|nr:DUF2341 domain-containing protein [Thermofilum sp.]MCI4407738.1 DUF2341 domain-containing protein [Thermofilum sp.]
MPIKEWVKEKKRTIQYSHNIKTIKKTVLFVLLLFTLALSIKVFSAPTFYWDSNKPSWYDVSLQPGQYKVVAVPEYGKANFTFSQWNNDGYSKPPASYTLTWSVATDYTLYGGKALMLEVDFSNGVQECTLTLKPSTGTTLFPIAVAVYIYTTASVDLGYFSPSNYLKFTYTDGSTQTIIFSGVTTANAWTRATAYVNASKPVSQIDIGGEDGGSNYYILKYRIYIEYSAPKILVYSISGNTVVVPSLFNTSSLSFTARFPKPLISISPTANIFLDEAYGNKTGTYTATLYSYVYVYTLAQKYTLSLLDGRLNTIASSTGSGKVTVASDISIAYLKLNSTLLNTAQGLNNTILNIPGSYVYTITFSVSSGSIQQSSTSLSGLTPSKAVNWLSGYSYRKEIYVLGSSSGSVTNYPVAVTVYYGSGVDTPSAIYLNGKCRPDFSDVIFTANDGKTILKSWLRASVNGQYALFWVELPVVPPYPSITSFYVYYGSSQSIAVRSLPSLYYYDNFENYADNTAIPVQGIGSAVVFTVNNTKVLQLTQINASGALTLVANTINYGRIILRVYVPAMSGSQGFYAGWSDGSQFLYGSPLNSLMAMLTGNAIWVVINGRPMIGLSTTVKSGWYTLDVKWYNQFLEVTVVPESSPNNAVTLTYIDSSIVSYNYNYLTIGVNSSTTCLIDYVGQANYVRPEPSLVGVGSEEKMGLVLPTLPTPGSSIVTVPIQDPSLQHALSDPVARYMLEMMFVFSLFIAITRFEPRLPVALASTGIIVAIVGFLIGDTNLVVTGAVLIAVSVAWGLM